MISIAIMGYGTVGAGVAALLEDNSSRVTRACGTRVKLKKILDLREFPGDRFASLVVHDFKDILEDPEIRVVCECMGGKTYAYDYTKMLLAAGKSVVTSNKDLVAAHGAELLKLAKESGVRYLFEASVGGGIPLLGPMSRDLGANRFREVYGILNGTTNYILTSMAESSAEFDVCLKEAQDMGYAERNPANDVEGRDTANKVSILASLAFGKHVYPESVETEGILGVSHEDILLAESIGCRIKLIGRALLDEEERVYAFVAPHFVSSANRLAGVNGVFNGVILRADAVGDVMLYGRGAGRMPTASAVAGDVIEAVRTPSSPLPPLWEDGAEISDGSEHVSRWFVRSGVPVDASYFDAFDMISASAFLTGPMKNHDFHRRMDLFRKKYPVVNAFRVLD